MFDLARLIHSATLRVPQKYAVRSGLRIKASSTAEHAAFWNIFTSKEFLRFVPDLIKSGIKPALIIDCGAACGYFSLLMEHLQLTGILDWHTNYLLVEPATFNIKKLEEHFSQDTFKGRVEIEEGVIGLKEGSVHFTESNDRPFGGSVKHQRKGMKTVSKSYLDISGWLQQDCLLKLDIEGSEFDFFKVYAHQLDKVLALVVDWHGEHQQDDAHLQIIERAGLVPCAVSREGGGRITQLFLRSVQ